MKSPSPLVLASTSPYRRELLERLGVPFETASPGVEETPLPGEAPEPLAARLAHAKAAAVAQRRPDAWVIGSDQVAVVELDGGRREILGKPGTAARCVEQLRLCNGRAVRFLTAVALVRADGDAAAHAFLDETTVRFRRLDAQEIDRYVARESPLDCAGGFKSEGLGISLAQAVESRDPTALIGLPLIGVAEALRSVGYRLP